jgi:transcriptional regulator with XRE-family HTH domain
MTSFGQRLSVAMKNAQKSQSDIARELSVSQPSVHAWVHDKNWPSIKNVLALESYLGVSVNWLLVGEDFET